ncbi:MAG: exosome complex protein Rrp42 [Thermosphaera sp.]
MSITPIKEPILPRMQAETILRLLKKGERIDGRGLLDYRPISVYLNPIEKAEGSAHVILGTTQVVTGVKIELGEPFPDRPDEGVLQVHAEFVPLASQTFEPGPPDENSIEVARVIDRSLREPKAIDFKQLVVAPGRKVWVVFNDIYLIDYGGNIVDASMISSMLALATAKMPYYEEKEPGVYVVDNKRHTTPLPVNTLVATVTMGIHDDVIVVDPSVEEELVLNSFITIAVDEKGRICGIQKKGVLGLERRLLDQAVEIAFNRGRVIIDLIRKILNNPSDYMKPLENNQ